MTDLAAWLLTQIADDEAAARAATPGPWEIGTVTSDFHTADVYSGGTAITSAYEEPCCAEEDAVHIARHDPARVLADCAAKRARVERCTDVINDRVNYDTVAREFAEDMLLFEAQPYADRPGFDPAWKVET